MESIKSKLVHEYDNKNRQIFACEIKPLSKNNELINIWSGGSACNEIY